MPRSPLTNKGQVAIPIRAAIVDVSTLRGLLRRPRRKAVSVATMNDAIRHRHRKPT
jgi:hypothetical protein